MSFNPPPRNDQRPDQNSLLRFGIENAAPGAILQIGEDVKAGRRPDLNSAMLKHIMGVSPADRMIECVGVIDGKWIDPETGNDLSADITLEDKLRAWDDLEMLVEDLDNAGDLKFNNLWKPIVAHLSDPVDEVRAKACWVLGTAVQNDPKAKAAFLELDPIPTLVSLVNAPGTSDETRNKAMYCISSTLKHSGLALDQFDRIDGWTVLNQALQDPSASLRAKTAFLLSSLVIQADVPVTIIDSMRESSIISTLITSLTAASLPTGPNGDVETIDEDYREKALRVLINIAADMRFDDAERKQVLDVATTLESDGLDLEENGLSEQEWKEFKAYLASGVIPGRPVVPPQYRFASNHLDNSIMMSSIGGVVMEQVPTPHQRFGQNTQDRSLVGSTAAAPHVRLARGNDDNSLLSTSIGLTVLEEVPATLPRIPFWLDESIPTSSTGAIALVSVPTGATDGSDDETPAS